MDLDQVHGRHGEPGTIDHTADAAIEADVFEPVGQGRRLAGILLAQVPLGLQVRLTEQGIVIQIDLGVQGDQLAPGGHHQRIDLHQVGVARHEEPVEPGHDLTQGLDLVAGQAETEAQPAHLKGLHPVSDRGGRVDAGQEDLFRVRGGHRLDIDAARRRGHEQDLPGLPFHQYTEVQLPGNGGGLLDQQGAHRQARGSALMGDQPAAEQALGLGHCPRLAVHLHHPADLAAPAGVDLGLDDPGCPPEGAAGGRGGLRGGDGHAPGDGDAILSEKLLRLIFVQVH